MSARELQQSMIDVVVHVGGDLHRIVLGGIVPLPGETVHDQMKFLKAQGDGLRKILLFEPRGGHPSLFADLVVPPSHPDADAGFIIMEMMGYPLISGTNTMSTAIALLETGRLPMRDGVSTVTLEAGGGLQGWQGYQRHLRSPDPFLRLPEERAGSGSWKGDGFI